MVFWLVMQRKIVFESPRESNKVVLSSSVSFFLIFKSLYLMMSAARFSTTVFEWLTLNPLTLYTIRKGA